MTNPQLILDRLTAWVEKQSSIGPAAFKQALAEIRRDVEREARLRESFSRGKPESIDTWRKFDDATPTEARSLVTWGYGELTAFTWAGYGWEDSLGVEVKPGGWSDKRQDNPDLLEYWRYIDTPESK